jgi:predicted transposase YbfD/YdcC
MKQRTEQILKYISVVIFFVVISYVVVANWNDNIMASLTAMLVGITISYAALTFEILKESKKDREMQLILRKLEDFYTPLINNEVFWQDKTKLSTFAHSSDSVECKDSHIESIYLFSWDNVPGNDNDRLLRYLKDEHDIRWVESAKIKSVDDKTIRVYNADRSVEITIDKIGGIATLEISDGRINDLKIKKENGGLNIYDSGRGRAIDERIRDFWIIYRNKKFLASHKIREEVTKNLERYFKMGKQENYSLRHSNEFKNFKRDFKKLLEEEYGVLMERVNQLGKL